MRECRWWLVLVFVASLAACRESSPRVASQNTVVDTVQEARQWARAIDSVARSAQPKDFSYPSRSTEGGEGHIYHLADNSVRIDVNDFGEIGRHAQRFYARDSVLRLVVRSDERYDSPLSGVVIRTSVDSVWFDGGSAIRWVDTAQTVRVRPDSGLAAHGARVFSEFNWAMRMARTNAQPSDSTIAKKSDKKKT